MATRDNRRHDVDRVASRDACPTCGERECDELVWLDDERVECQRCETVYRPGQRSSQEFEQQDAWLRLLQAAESLLEARTDQMVTVVEWRALRRTARKCRRYKKAVRPGGSGDAEGTAI
jgi:hypothetical protein